MRTIDDRITGTHGAFLILEERNRQIDEEGWTVEHDDQHRVGELARAAGVYAIEPHGVGYWPGKWRISWFKPTCMSGVDGRIRELVKAGALIAAEIDRLDRLQRGKNGQEEVQPRGKHGEI